MRRIEPGPGQESVWDYPRPPAVRPEPRSIRIEHGGQTLASTQRAIAVLETSHPPVYMIPRADCDMGRLTQNHRSTTCEFKGRAVYFDLQGDGPVRDVAWSYPEPARGYQDIAGHLAFYASRVDACFVGDERVQAQAGDFYGGWITKRIVGPFKGGAGTWGW